MSWYDYKRWKENIRKQRETNTPRAFIHTITKFVTSKPFLYYRDRGFIENNGIDMIMGTLIWFLSHSEFANEGMYNQVRSIASQVSENDKEYVRGLEESVCTNMPYWFAKALKDKKVPMPEHTSFKNMSYHVNDDVLRDYGDSLPIDIRKVLEYSKIENTDTFRKLFFTRDKDEIPDLLSRMNYTNLRHIDLDFMNEILSTYSYNSLKNLIGELSNPEIIFNTSISALYVLECCYNEVWSHISNDTLLLWIARNPVLTLEKFIEITSTLNHTPNSNIYERLGVHNTKITLDIIRSDHTIDVSTNTMIILSRKDNITIRDVLDTLHLQWDWESLSRNQNIATPDNIEKYPELPWVWGKWGISASESLTEEFIEKNFVLLNTSTQAYDGGSLLQNPCVTLNIVESHPEIRWDYSHNGLSSNPNVTLPYFIKNTDKDWELYAIAENSTLCENTAIKAIQSCWRIYKTRQKAKLLAEQVVEWSYHPDCKPAMEIRKRQFEENRGSLFI